MAPKQIFNCPTPQVCGSYSVLLRHQFCADSAVVLCWSTAVVMGSLGISFLLVRQQFFDFVAFVFCSLGSSFLLVSSSSWLAGRLGSSFCSFGSYIQLLLSSCFSLPRLVFFFLFWTNRHTLKINFQLPICPTLQQLFFADSLAVFCLFGSSF